MRITIFCTDPNFQFLSYRALILTLVGIGRKGPQVNWETLKKGIGHFVS